MTEIDLSGRVALVTGASRGIGYFVARGLAAAGAHVIAIARPRSVGALEELDDEIQALGGSATLVPVDLTDGAAIDTLAGAIAERWKKLDILIGNAGVLGVLSPVGHIEVKDWEELMDVNVTANWRLLRGLDPLLMASDAGRVVFVTSGAAHKAKPFWSGYAASKAALEALALTYANERRDSSIRVNMINPGPVRTGMRAKAMPGENPDTLPHPSELVPLFLELSSPDLTSTGRVVNFQDRQK